MIGELIDHYRILELIGQGAMGAVYKALDVNLDRRVAVKVMSAEVRSDPDFVERFRQEARLQGALIHPNVATLFDYFVHEGTPVAVMEFIDGESLEQLIRRRGAIPAHQSIPIFKQALRAVAAAHRAGIIHRDLKPSNLMITRDDVLKVMDFGIAKRQGTTGATQVSTSVGTVLYMAPEQILGRAVDCRTDVYGLGITLYEMLSGQPPFSPRGKVPYMVLSAHVNDLPQPPTVHCRSIPQPIVNAVMRALAKDPNARFQSTDEFMQALPDVSAPDATAQPPVPNGTPARDVPPPASADSPDTPQRSGTLVLEHARSTRHDPYASMTRQDTAATPRSAPTAPARPSAPPPPVSPASSAPSPPVSPASSAPSRGLMQRLRADRPIIAVLLVSVLVLGRLIGYTHQHVTRRGRAGLPAAAAATPSAPALAASPGPARSPALAASSGPSRSPATASRTPSAPPSLAGTWRGEYIEASGRLLLRVVSLSIDRVDEDGGIEGRLRYVAASGQGQCRLYPRGSRYSVGQQRLRLSPEGCSPHYPKELGVPLDFAGVDPRASTLRDGRIEAPTGELIKASLTRVSGF